MKFEWLENKRVDEKIFFGTHESGLKIYVIPKKEFSKSYAIYGTEYGSIDREFIPLGDTEKVVLPDGVAHFLEHKLFEEEDGTDAFNRFALPMPSQALILQHTSLPVPTDFMII